MGKQLVAKIAVSTVALLVAIFAMIDAPAAGRVTPMVFALLVIAALPWLASVVDSVEIPGLKLQLKKIDANVQRQGADVEVLKFLMSGFVTNDELVHLRKLSAGEPFPFVPGPETAFFLEELRRLRSLGLISGHPGKGIRSLERTRNDVKDHFFITERGTQYLTLRDGS